MIIYGIPNCDSVKKALKWLDNNAITYRFYDFRKEGIKPTLIQDWLTKVPYTAFINQRSTTWKSLSEEDKATLNNDKAIALCVKYPTLIKRPVLEYNNQLHFGFDDATYTQFFK